VSDMTVTPDPALCLGHYPHRYVTILRPSDGDASGHISNGKIAALGDDARVDLHDAILIDPAPGHSLVMLESRFRFYHELTYPAELMIGVGITAIGNSSVREVMGFFVEGRCEVVAHLVMVKVLDGRSVPLRPEEKLRAERFLVG